MFPACVAPACWSLHSSSTLLFQGVFWTQAAALLHVPHSRLSQKVPEDGIFHNKEAHLRFQASDVLQRSSRGSDQCLRTCIKQVAAQKTNRKWSKKIKTGNFCIFGGEIKINSSLSCLLLLEGLNISIYRFLSVSYRFSSHAERTCTARSTASLDTVAAIDPLLKCRSGNLRLPLGVQADAKLLCNCHPTTGNLSCPLIPSQTPTRCLASVNTEVKSATQVSQIRHKCWQRCRQGRFRQELVAEVKGLVKKKKKVLRQVFWYILVRCFFLFFPGAVWLATLRYMPVEVRQGESIRRRWREEMAARKILDILSLSVRTLISSSPVLALGALITPDHLSCHVWNMSHL